MRNTSPMLSRCTVERKNGTFCDTPTMVDAPFPICTKHAIKLYKHMLDVARYDFFGMERPEEKRADHTTWTLREANHKTALQMQSMVYYVRIHDFIKIGYTTNVKQRMSQLRVHTDAILATEPGGRDLERDRHKQFADLRIGTMENFKPTKRLIDHIDAVREYHGEPAITGCIPSYLD
jgi:hypothetical protein